MGFYINPPNMTKEDFLLKFGKSVTEEEVRSMKSEDYKQGDRLPVCLVYNAAFTAAAIVYGPSELDAVTRPDDPRPKLYALVLKKDLSKENGADQIPERLLGT